MVRLPVFVSRWQDLHQVSCGQLRCGISGISIGLKVPVYGEAILKMPEGDFTYARFVLEEIEYNCSEFMKYFFAGRLQQAGRIKSPAAPAA
ncbi:MAG: hypothetical protein WCK53_01915 [Methanomicrobiales archaeon]